MGVRSFLRHPYVREADLFKQYEVDDGKYHEAHWVLTFTYVGLMVAFVVIRSLFYINRSTVEQFQFQNTSSTKGLIINVQLECSNPGHCGDAVISTSYSQTPTCQQFAPDTQVNYSDFAATPLLPLPVCWSQYDTQGLDLWFSGITDMSKRQYTGLGSNITVARAYITYGATAFEVDVALEAMHRKTLILGMYIKKYGKTTTVEPVFNSLQYDGTTTAGTSAVLRIRLSQFANVFVLSRPGSILDVLSDIGGAAGFLLGFMKVVTIIFPYAQGKFDEYQDKKDSMRGTTLPPGEKGGGSAIPLESKKPTEVVVVTSP